MSQPLLPRSFPVSWPDSQLAGFLAGRNSRTALGSRTKFSWFCSERHFVLRVDFDQFYTTQKEDFFSKILYRIKVEFYIPDFFFFFLNLPKIPGFVIFPWFFHAHCQHFRFPGCVGTLVRDTLTEIKHEAILKCHIAVVSAVNQHAVSRQRAGCVPTKQKTKRRFQCSVSENWDVFARKQKAKSFVDGKERQKYFGWNARYVVFVRFCYLLGEGTVPVVLGCDHSTNVRSSMCRSLNTTGMSQPPNITNLSSNTVVDCLESG